MMAANSPVGNRKGEQTGHDAQTKRFKRTLDNSEDGQMLSSTPPETAKGEALVKSKKRKAPTTRENELSLTMCGLRQLKHQGSKKSVKIGLLSLRRS